MHHRDADAPCIPAADEGAGTVNGVDDEDGGAGKPVGIVIRLFGKPAIIRPGGAQDGFEDFIGGVIGRADRRKPAIFPPDLGILAEETEGRLARLAGGLKDQPQIGGPAGLSHIVHFAVFSARLKRRARFSLRTCT